MKYKKKPVIIEAWQYKGNDDFEGAPSWVVEAFENDVLDAAGGRYYINTLEGKMYISPMDYIIRGVRGELYPCKPFIFEETYEEAE